eukprot:scaffold3307_cov265-Pinguiococcus_pyrenoidosus.AAC.9
MRRPLRPSLGDLDAFAGWRKLQAWRQLPGKSKDRRGSRRGHLDVSPTCDKCSQPSSSWTWSIPDVARGSRGDLFDESCPDCACVRPRGHDTASKTRPRRQSSWTPNLRCFPTWTPVWRRRAELVAEYVSMVIVPEEGAKEAGQILLNATTPLLSEVVYRVCSELPPALQSHPLSRGAGRRGEGSTASHAVVPMTFRDRFADRVWRLCPRRRLTSLSYPPSSTRKYAT